MSEIEQPNKDLFLEIWEKSKDDRATTQYYRDEFISSMRKKTVETAEAKASFDCYIGTGNRQWDAKAVDTLNRQGRPVNTFNVVKPNIDKVFGQIIMNPNSTFYSPINQKTVTKSNIMDSLFQYDFDRGNWQKEKNRFIKDTLIHTGILEMYKDYRHSKMGNVGIRALNRYSDIVLDGYWNTDNISDCRYIFKSTWLTAREIKDIYRTKSEEIDQSIDAYEKIKGMDDISFDRDEIADRGEYFFDTTNNRYRVIEVVYMQQIPNTKKYSKKLRRFLKENELPDIMREQSETIVDFTEYESVCKIMTMAPGVAQGLILQKGDHPVQVGRLPFFIASADKTMGVSQGLVTGLIDAQVTLNKRASMLTGNQITSTNGGLIAKQGFFKDDNESKRFVKERTVPGSVFWADDDAKLNDGIAPIPSGRLPDGTVQSIDKMEEFIEKYTNSTAAVSGRSEGANESGVLFESKKMQSQVAHVTISETLSQIDRELAEAYFYFAKKVYSGPERQFRNAKTEEFVEINKRVSLENFSLEDVPENATTNKYLANGLGEPAFVIINDIQNLPRHDVIIKKSEMGLDQKQRALSVYSEMMQRSINPIMKSHWEKSMIPMLDIPEQNIKEMEEAATLFIQFQTIQTEAQIIAATNNSKQSTIQTNQMEQQAQQAQQPQVQPGQIQDARSAANQPGQGNLPEGIAEDSTGANNQSPSDI